MEAMKLEPEQRVIEGLTCPPGRKDRLFSDADQRGLYMRMAQNAISGALRLANKRRSYAAQFAWALRSAFNRHLDLPAADLSRAIMSRPLTRRLERASLRPEETSVLTVFNSQEGERVMALGSRTKLGIVIAVSVVAGLAFVWLAVILLLAAAFLIVWGQAPGRTEEFVKGLPYGNSIIGALEKWV